MITIWMTSLGGGDAVPDDGSLTPLDIRLLSTGDPRLLPLLVARYQAGLTIVARRLADGIDDADDLLQELWIRVAEKGATCRGDGSLGGWLHAILRSVAADRRRTRRRQLARLRGATSRGDETGAAVAPAADARLVEADETRWRRGRLRTALLRLTPRQRRAILLRFHAQLPVEQVAARLGCAPGTVKATVSQALARLRQLLPREEFIDR